MTDSGQSEVVFCPLAELPPRGLRVFVRSGRLCKVDGVICFNYEYPDLYKNCPVRKEFVK